MNRKIPVICAAIVSLTILLFGICILTDFTFGAYFVCLFLPVGYIIMAAGLQHVRRQYEHGRCRPCRMVCVFSSHRETGLQAFYDVSRVYSDL